jgi:hypothetical protein
MAAGVIAHQNGSQTWENPHLSQARNSNGKLSLHGRR